MKNAKIRLPFRTNIPRSAFCSEIHEFQKAMQSVTASTPQKTPSGALRNAFTVSMHGGTEHSFSSSMNMGRYPPMSVLRPIKEVVAVVAKLTGAHSDELTRQIIENGKKLAALRAYAKTA